MGYVFLMHSEEQLVSFPKLLQFRKYLLAFWEQQQHNGLVESLGMNMLTLKFFKHLFMLKGATVAL